MTLNKIEYKENIIEKAKAKLGKPYSQQLGRKHGKGAGHIVEELKRPSVKEMFANPVGQLFRKKDTTYQIISGPDKRFAGEVKVLAIMVDDNGELDKDAHPWSFSESDNSKDSPFIPLGKGEGELKVSPVTYNIGGKKYTAYFTGNEEIDISTAQLDGVRYDVFYNHAPANVKKYFDKLEDSNMHWYNSKMVNEFFHYMGKGGNPAKYVPSITKEKFTSWDDKPIRFGKPHKGLAYPKWVKQGE